MTYAGAYGEKCDRCGTHASVMTLSWFDLAHICLDCRRDEADAPNYEKARKAEDTATRSGIQLMREGAPESVWRPLLNFPGIGLAAEDAAFLEERRRSRCPFSGAPLSGVELAAKEKPEGEVAVK